MNRYSHLVRHCLLSLTMTTAATMAAAQELPSSSPFLPPADHGAANAAGAKYQLGGIINSGKDLMVSITRLTDKQSFWIPVGGTVNEITVIRCDPDHDEATIRAGGEQLTLSLRKAIVQVGTTSPVAATAESPGTPVVTPPLPPPSGPPEVQEREARMLVTDLLEIGQQHRKAYEEAQRKAAAEKKK